MQRVAIKMLRVRLLVGALLHNVFVYAVHILVHAPVTKQHILVPGNER